MSAQKKRTKQKDPLRAQYDAAWKEALDHFLQPFMELCLPAIAAEIDWSKSYVSLEQELCAITRGRRRAVDKLFQVALKDGSEAWLFLHIEVQSQYDADFSERMFVYNYRLWDRSRKPIMSIAILADNSPSWRPTRYQRTSWHNTMSFEFVTVKLMDYAAQELQLAHSTNPFAIVIWAHLQTLKTRKTPDQRQRSKFAITRALYERGFTKDYIVKLFHFIDSIMVLPEALALEYDKQVRQLEEEKHMAYMTHIERHGIQQGMQQAGAALILRLLKRRFEHVPALYMQRITEADMDTLFAWGEKLLDGTTLAEIFDDVSEDP